MTGQVVGAAFECQRLGLKNPGRITAIAGPTVMTLPRWNRVAAP